MNEASITGFSLYFSINIPAGILITPYATKNEKGRKAANVKLRSKLLIISGIIGPSIFVSKEITKKIKNIRTTM